MESKQRVKLGDVAKRVGVHPSTASRVLNPKTRDMVSPALAQRILSVANEMGYSPNPFALGLRTQRSHAVGVMIPDLSNPVFPPIILGIERVLEEAGYTAILANSDIRADHDRAILEKLKVRQVDGLILATAHREDPVIEECLAEHIPLVLVNRTIDGDNAFSVINDDAWGMALAVGHMVEQGHTRVAYLSGSQTLSTGYARHQGFVNAMRENNLEPDDDLIEFCDAFTMEAGSKAMGRLLARSPDFTAVITANDLLALGCYDAFAERGLRCPDDISITGVNDMPFSDKFSPPLTTVRIPLDDMGAETAKMLLQIIQDPSAEPKTVKLKPQLIVRSSTARVS